MNPVNNNININSAALTGAANRTSSTDRSADWFSLSNASSGEAISASPLFDAGATVDEISAQILSHISGPDSQF